MGEECEITPVSAPVPTLGAPAVSEERYGVSHTVELRDFSELVRRLSLDLRVILKERQQHTFALEKKLKTAEVAPVRKEI